MKIKPSKFGITPLAFGVITALFLFTGSARALEDGGFDLHVPIANSHGRKKSYPYGWKVKEFKGKADVEVIDTKIGKALHLRSSAASTAVTKEMQFDPRQYPVINWQWMAKTLPVKADAREKNSDDQAIQLYVVFSHGWPAALNNRLIGYIWDTSAPVGSIIPSAKSSNVKYIVIRSGDAGLGRWFPEKRNVYEDYKRLFNEEPAKGVTGISVMIDSDDTESSAESYIGGIYLAGKEAAL